MIKKLLSNVDYFYERVIHSSGDVYFVYLNNGIFEITKEGPWEKEHVFTSNGSDDFLDYYAHLGLAMYDLEEILTSELALKAAFFLKEAANISDLIGEERVNFTCESLESFTRELTKAVKKETNQIRIIK